MRDPGLKVAGWPRSGALARFFVLGALLLVRAGAAQEAVQHFDLPSLPADAALREFARQSGQQILFPFTATLGRTAPELRGDYTPLAALGVLAAAAGLAIGNIEGRTITLVPLADPGATPASRPVVGTMGSAAAAPAPLPAPAPLQEIVVTATKRSDRAHRVPLSITVETRETLEEKSVRDFRDLSSRVPGLAFNALAPSTANLILRGVTDGGNGAATTGFYLDDSPLAKRNVEGVRSGSGNGTPLPPLFDVERIEILRGPQGTLFGSGSVGGTIRYIHTPPDLQADSGRVATSVRYTEHGDPTADFGVAFGGPLIEDRLAFRLAGWGRETGGYLDFIDPYSGDIAHADANGGRSSLFRGALLWAPRDDTHVSLSYLTFADDWDSTTTSYTPPLDHPIVEPTLCFDTRGISPAQPVPNPLPVPCGSAGVTHVREGRTYGPFPDLKPDQTLAQAPTPWETTVHAPTLTIDVDLGAATVKSISAYVQDDTRLLGTETLTEVRERRSGATFGAISIPRGLRLSGISPAIEDDNGRFRSMNRREGYSQELRLSSVGPPDRANWLLGFYYSRVRTTAQYDVINNDLERIAQYLYGITAAERYGVSGYLLPDGQIGTDHKVQHLDEREIAVFGEGRWWPTPRLGFTVGLRYSDLRFDYDELHYGAASGFLEPTAQNGGGPNVGSTTEGELSPRLGVQWQHAEDRITYLNVARGFRPGGVNVAIAQNVCSAGLAQYGLDVADLPPTYASDDVWSYELGGKFRWWDKRVQLSTAVYRIDRNDAQVAVSLGNNCSFPFQVNAGVVRSEGVELEIEARLASALTVNAALAYTDAAFTEDAIALKDKTSVPLLFARKGQRVPVAPWTVVLGARLDFRLAGLPGYVRADWSWSAALENSPAQTYGLPGYAPDARFANTHVTNLRLGMEGGRWHGALLVSNVFDERDGAMTGGRSGCALPAAGGDAACSAYAAYNPIFSVTPAYPPRQIGIELGYRY